MNRKLLVLWFLVPIFSAAVLSQTSAPASAFEKSASGLNAAVTIRRDSRGIPYVEAAGDDDLYFAQGYATASDRLWQMDLLRRVARGETAEIFGQVAVNEDIRWRRFGFARIAELNVATLSQRTRAALQRYADGVNAYLSEVGDDALPVEFKILRYRPRPWTPADSIVVGKILSDALSTTWNEDILKASLQSLAPEKLAQIYDRTTPDDVVLFGKDIKRAQQAPTGAVPTVSTNTLLLASRNSDIRRASLERAGLYAEDLAASNNWVISGTRTASGKAMLANDPHLRPTAPGIWYLTSLSAPGIRVAGVTVPGVPGVIVGHNENIAWGMTNVGPDVQDVYRETFDAAGRYKTPDGWKEPTIRTETILVRSNSAEISTQKLDIKVIETRNGPVIVDEGTTKYALKWTALDPATNEFGAFSDLNRAGNWAEFKKALSTYGGPAQNFVFADTKGNIGWQVAGRIPIRQSGDGSLPYDGASGKGAWTGNIRFEELPNLYNPPAGFIVTANQRTVGTDYKYQSITRAAAEPWRARRIYDLLSAGKKFDFAAVSEIQYDSFNIPLKRLAETVIAEQSVSAQSLDILKRWDGRMTPDSRAALLAFQLRQCAAGKIAAANAPLPADVAREHIVDRAVAAKTEMWLPAEFASYKELFAKCEAESTADFAKRFGPDSASWVWGRLSAARFPHPLAGVPLIGRQFATPNPPLSGSAQSPNVASNVSMRFITIPGLWDETRQVIPLGQSGDPRSTNFKDQFDLWRTGAPAIFPFSAAAVERSSVSKMTLKPSAAR